MGINVNKLKSNFEIFNICSSKPIKITKIIDVIKLFYKHFQKYEDFEKIKNLIKNKKKSTGEIPFQSMDYKKLYKFFKWKPKYNLSNTIEETYKWYYNFFKKKI
jgi:dTDP-D-glucose 4,6-dehydratase